MKFNDTISVAKSLENKQMNFNFKYFPDCVLLTRYWITIGKTDEEVYNLLYDKLKTVHNDFGGYIANSDTVRIINMAKKLGSIKDYTIQFSQQELDYIHGFNSLPLEKVLFIMFCAYKIEDSHRFIMKQSEVMNFAKNSYNKTYADNIIGRILDDGAFETDIYHNNLRYYPTQKTLDLFNEDNVVLVINDFRNLVYYYLEYIGEGKYGRCENCGIIISKRSNRQKYCAECRKILHNLVSKKSMGKKRGKK